MQGILRATSHPRSLLAHRLRMTRSGPGFRHQLIRTLITKNFSRTHEMLIFDDSTGLGTVHITDHAQSTLGDVVFVELKAPGEEVQQGNSIGAVESVKAVSDIYAPVSGTITEINKDIFDEPGLLNKSAQEKGWLCKIKLSDPKELKGLLTEEVYLETL